MGKKPYPKRSGKSFPLSKFDSRVQEEIARIETHFKDHFDPIDIHGLNAFQRKQLHLHFEKHREYLVRLIRDQTGREGVLVRVYPLGELQRMAEAKVQEVLITGEPQSLPPMDPFARFLVHDYLKNREGIRTESFGEGKERHVRIFPVFGRELKKAKRRLIR